LIKNGVSNLEFVDIFRVNSVDRHLNHGGFLGFLGICFSELGAKAGVHPPLVQIPLDAQYVAAGAEALPALHAQADDDAADAVHPARLRRLHAEQWVHQRDRCAVSGISRN